MRLDIRIIVKIIDVLTRYRKKYERKLKREKDKEWDTLFEKSDKLKASLNDGLLIYHYHDSILSRLIYDGFEETEIAFLRRFLKQSDAFIDIGSNLGLFSLHAAQIVGNQGKVYAFEPAPATYARLIENVNLNGYGNIINCFSMGLSDQKGVLTMNTSSKGYDAWNSFAPQAKEYFDGQISVRVDTLDNFINDHLIDIKDIAIIKLDVEGWEYFVLKGAYKTLSNENSPALIVEFTEENAFNAGTNCYELYDSILSYGYSWYTYDAKQNQLVAEPKRLHYPYNNLIAIKDLEEALLRLK